MGNLLQDKVVLVSGASTGIGRETCKLLAQAGAKVILLSRDVASMEETVNQMAKVDHLMLPLDLANFEDYPAAVSKMTEWNGVPWGIAWCSGLSVKSRLRDTLPHIMNTCMRINCFSFVEMMRLLVKAKKKTEPMKAVVISSLASLGQHKYFTAYAASKAALESAARVLAVELMPRNVFINIIRCAIVGTRITVNASEMLGDINDKLKENGYQPLGVIPPADVARMVTSIMGPDMGYSTGCYFTINAGAPN